MSSIHVVDTGVFVAMGRPSNRRYRAVRRFARRNGITFVVPPQVYDELAAGDGTAERLPVDTAIDDGFARLADPLEYTDPFVSRIADGVQRYIANAADRPENDVERADVSLAGTVAKAFVDGTADRAFIYTTDIAAGEGAVAVFASEGYGDSVAFVNGFRFVEDLLD